MRVTSLSLQIAGGAPYAAQLVLEVGLATAVQEVPLNAPYTPGGAIDVTSADLAAALRELAAALPAVVKDDVMAPLHVIAPYCNPMGWRARLANFRRFEDALLQTDRRCRADHRRARLWRPAVRIAAARRCAAAALPRRACVLAEGKSDRAGRAPARLPIRRRGRRRRPVSRPALGREDGARIAGLPRRAGVELARQSRAAARRGGHPRRAELHGGLRGATTRSGAPSGTTTARRRR